MKRTSTLILMTVALVLMLALAAPAATVSCTGIAAWSGNSVAYATGALVTYNGSEYKCLQAHTSQAGWDPADVPALWSLQGTCTTSTPTPTPTATAKPTATPTATPTPTAKPTATPTPTAKPTATPTPTAKPTATPTPTAKPTATPTPTGPACWAAWVSTTAYTGGAQVSFKNVNYQAAFWTQNNEPDTNNGPAGSGQPWIPEGACGGGGGATPTPTATATATPTATAATPTPTATTKPTATPTPTSTPNGNGTGPNHVGYFVQWGIYGRGYNVNELVTTGNINRYTIINYAFENFNTSGCFNGVVQATTSNPEDPNQGLGAGDAFADYAKSYQSDTVSGSADVFNQPIEGSFNQLKELKAKYPNVKILVSLGGWTYSHLWSDVAA